MAFGALLVDARGEIRDRCFGTPKTAAYVDRLGGSPGVRITEEAWGTNALATPIETRHPIFISGEEHYLEILKSVSCFGMPIVHPLTRRLEGVLDLICRTKDASPLMRPVVATAVRDILDRLVQESAEITSSAFNAFRKACASTTSPILLVDQDEMYCNIYASDAFTSPDYNLVREAIASAPANGTCEVTLSSGLKASLRVTTPGREGQQVVSVSLADRDRKVIPRRRPTDVSIHGQLLDTLLAEAGSGEGRADRR
ncbi:hypothetical protein HJ581_0041605 [Rhodococcus opacus]|nr:hypothetical protein HJ581_0041605 [Rhodococcus opacus]